jgi:hypothetical protein
VTSLLEIEACPRRWGLAYADYREVWNRHAYPPRLFIAGLTGRVVHLALQTITKAFAQSGCTSLKDASAVEQGASRFNDRPRSFAVLERSLAPHRCPRRLKFQTQHYQVGSESRSKQKPIDTEDDLIGT